MKKIIFFFLGLLVPILVGMWFNGFFDVDENIMFPLAFIVGLPQLILIFLLPIIIWAIVMSIYGFKNKPVLYVYTSGMIIGIILAFTLIPNLDMIKVYLGIE